MTAAVFPCLPNALEPYKVGLSFSTDIINAYQDNEQRIQLRRIPRRSERFVARSLAAPDMARLDALAIGGQIQQWILPYWPHGAQLTGSAGPGADTLLCDTADRDFVNGGLVVLWQDSGTFEAATITSLSAGHIGATLADAWPVGTWAFPGRLARWGANPAMRRIMQAGADATVTFDLDVLPLANAGQLPGLVDPDVATPASPLVFAAAYPDRFRQEPTDQLGRSVARFDNPTGAFADYARGPIPIGQHSLALWLASLADVNLLLTWYYGQKGALAPFWLPTYQADFEPVADIGAGDTAITIIAQNYTAWSFPTGARSHLACFPPGGSPIHRQVIASVDNGDGTETLTLDAAVGAPIPRQGGLISQLLYVRLSRDLLDLQWTAPSLAEATLDVLETPRASNATPSLFTPPAAGAASAGHSVVSIGSGSSSAPATSGTGSVPTHGTKGTPVHIRVQARDANGVDLTTGGATVAGAVTGAESVALSFTDNSDGTYDASFTPSAAGDDDIAITMNSVAIGGSPFPIVISDVVDPASCTAVVPDGVVGQPRLVVVTLKDSSGRALVVGGATVVVTVTGTNAQTHTAADNANGTEQTSLSSGAAGSDSVAITVNGTPIGASPLTSVVAAAAVLTGLSISPASASVPPSGTQQFAAIGRFSDGSTGPASVTWSANGGTITAGGLYTAGATPGTFSVKATSIASPTVLAIAGVTVTSSAPTPGPVTGVPPVPAGLTLFARATFNGAQPPGSWVSGAPYGCPVGTIEQFFTGSVNDAGMLISPPGSLYFLLQAGKLPGTGAGTFDLWKDAAGTEMKEVFEIGCIRFGGLKADGTLSNDYEQQAIGTKIFGYWGVGNAPGTGAAACYLGMFTNLGVTSIITSGKVAFFQQSPGAVPQGRAMYQNLNLGTLLHAGAATNYALYFKLNDIGSPNGIFRMWLGTTQILDYSNITYRTAGLPHGFWQKHHNVIWGGGGGTPKTRDDQVRVDDVSLYGVPL